MKCPFCKHRVNRYDGHHIYNCDKNKTYLDKIHIKYQYLLFNYPIISDKNNLFQDYSIKSKSLPDIKKEYGISYNNIIFLLEYFSIKRRDMKSSSKHISTKKYKKTCLIKYGKDNYSKLKLNRSKKDNINLLENKDLYDQIKDILLTNKKDILKNALDRDNVLKKETSALYKKYYKYWLELSDEKKDDLLNKMEPLESRLSDILDRLKVPYTRNFKIGVNIFDFKIDDILIDVISDYWGANPKLYKNSDYLNYLFKKVRVSTIWNNKKSKNDLAEKRKFKVVDIWESDINVLDDNNFMLYVIERLK